MMMRISSTFPGECLKFIYSTAYRTGAKRENEAICGIVYGVCEVTMARASLCAVLHRHTHVILGRHNADGAAAPRNMPSDKGNSPHTDEKLGQIPVFPAFGKDAQRRSAKQATPSGGKGLLGGGHCRVSPPLVASGSTSQDGLGESWGRVRSHGDQGMGPNLASRRFLAKCLADDRCITVRWFYAGSS